MRKLLTCTLALTVLLLASCTASKEIPLKGSYLEPPYQITTDKTTEEVWDQLIDLFAQKGLPIKLIDKSSGLIISERSLLTTTIEDKEGKLKDDKAFIVVPKRYNRQTGLYVPILSLSDITGEWNVRVKKKGEQSLINVNIVNVHYEYYDPSLKTRRDGILYSYKSTGELEKLISNTIK
jgi:hypothetical protein